MAKPKAPKKVVRSLDTRSTTDTLRRVQQDQVAKLVARKQQIEAAQARLRTLREKAKMSTSSKYVQGRTVQTFKKLVRATKPRAEPLARRHLSVDSIVRPKIDVQSTLMKAAEMSRQRIESARKDTMDVLKSKEVATHVAADIRANKLLTRAVDSGIPSRQAAIDKTLSGSSTKSHLALDGTVRARAAIDAAKAAVAKASGKVDQADGTRPTSFAEPLMRAEANLATTKADATRAGIEAGNARANIDGLGPPIRGLDGKTDPPTKRPQEPVNARSPGDISARRADVAAKLKKAADAEVVAGRGRKQAKEDADVAARSRAEAEGALDGQRGDLARLKNTGKGDVDGSVGPAKARADGAGKDADANGLQEGRTRAEVDAANAALDGPNARARKNDSDVSDAAAKRDTAAKDMDAAAKARTGKEGTVRDAEAAKAAAAKPDPRPADDAGAAAARAKPEPPKNTAVTRLDTLGGLRGDLGVVKTRQAEVVRDLDSVKSADANSAANVVRLKSMLNKLMGRRALRLKQKADAAESAGGLKGKKDAIDGVEAGQAGSTLKKGQYGDSIVNHLNADKVYRIEGRGPDGVIPIDIQLKTDQARASQRLQTTAVDIMLRVRGKDVGPIKAKLRDLDGAVRDGNAAVGRAEGLLKAEQAVKDGLGNTLRDGGAKVDGIRDVGGRAAKEAGNARADVDGVGGSIRGLDGKTDPPTKRPQEPVNARSPADISARRADVAAKLKKAADAEGAAGKARKQAKEDADVAARSRAEAEGGLDGQRGDLARLKNTGKGDVDGTVGPAKARADGAGKDADANGRQEGRTRAEVDAANAALDGPNGRARKNDSDVSDAAAKRDTAAKDMDAAAKARTGKEGAVRDAEAAKATAAKPDPRPADDAGAAAVKAKPESPNLAPKNEAPLRNAKAAKETVLKDQDAVARNKADADAENGQVQANKGRGLAALQRLVKRIKKQKGNRDAANKVGDDLATSVGRLRAEEGGQLARAGGKVRGLDSVKMELIVRKTVDGPGQPDSTPAKLNAKRADLSTTLEAAAAAFGRRGRGRPSKDGPKQRTKTLDGVVKDADANLAKAEGLLKAEQAVKDGLGNTLRDGGAKVDGIKNDGAGAGKEAGNARADVDGLGGSIRGLDGKTDPPTKRPQEPVNSRSPGDINAQRADVAAKLKKAADAEGAAGKGRKQAKDDADVAARSRAEAEAGLDGQRGDMTRLKNTGKGDVDGRVGPAKARADGAVKDADANGRQEGKTRADLDAANAALDGPNARARKNDGDVRDAAAKRDTAAKDMDAAAKARTGKEGAVRDAEAAKAAAAKPDPRPADAAANAVPKAKPDPPRTIKSRFNDIVAAVKAKFKKLKDGIDAIIKKRQEEAQKRAKKREEAKKAQEEMKKKKKDEEAARKKKRDEEAENQKLKKKNTDNEVTKKGAQRRLLLIFGALFLIIFFLKPPTDGTSPDMPQRFNNITNEDITPDAPGNVQGPSGAGSGTGPGTTVGPTPMIRPDLPPPITWPSIDCRIGSVQYLRGCRDGSRQGGNDGGRDGYYDQIANAKRILPYSLGEVTVIAASTIRFTSKYQQDAFCRQVASEGLPSGYDLYTLYPSCGFSKSTGRVGPSGPSAASRVSGPSGPSGAIPGYGYGYGNGYGEGYGDGYGTVEEAAEELEELEGVQEGGLVRIARGEPADYRAGYLYGYETAYSICYPTGWGLAKSGTPAEFLPPSLPPGIERIGSMGPSGASGAMPGYGYGYGDGYGYGYSEAAPAEPQEGGKRIRGFSKKKSVALLNKLVGKTIPQSVQVM